MFEKMPKCVTDAKFKSRTEAVNMIYEYIAKTYFVSTLNKRFLYFKFL